MKGVTKHHVTGKGNGGSTVYMCRSCHNKEHGMNEEKITVTRLQQKIKRAQSRIKRDRKIVENAQAEILEILEVK